jgi:hypothetical protein
MKQTDMATNEPAVSEHTVQCCDLAAATTATAGAGDTALTAARRTEPGTSILAAPSKCIVASFLSQQGSADNAPLCPL